MQNPEKAITTLEKMIDKYRDNQVLTPLALYDLGAIYQNQSDPKLKGEKSFYKAIEYFNQILQKFPNAEIAPKALMNIGFIQENHLQKFEEAKATYQKLIDQYPASNLVESAKQAKAIVGVPPEEIINRTRVAKK
jgi:TolA-binding protein